MEREDMKANHYLKGKREIGPEDKVISRMEDAF